MSFVESYYGISVIFIILLFLYQSFQSYIEKKKIHIIHETGFGMLIGFIIGLFIKLSNEEFSFSGEGFFHIILPPIIFAAGYNLKKKRFFENIRYIALYSILGTIVSFLITLFMTEGFFNAGLIVALNGEKVPLKTKDILYYSATMCASDTIAALTLIDSKAQPKLFNLILGEGLLNDAVAIILFKSVETLIGKSGETELESSTILNLFLGFLKNCIISILIGAGTALIAALISKKFRFFMEDTIKVNIFLLLIGYLSYCIGELVHASSVICILTAGVIMNHYVRFNMTEQGRSSTTITLNTLSSISESFLFIYIGLSSWTYMGDNSKISLSFLGLTFISTIVGRFGCIYVTSAVAYIFMKKTWNVNKYEISIIWYSGLIRGSVAFALVETIKSQIHPVIVSTILFIVFLTTLFLGASMSYYVKFFSYLMNKNPEVKEREQRLIEQKNLQEREKQGKQNLVQNLNENILKPFFIHNYFNRKESMLMHKQKKQMEYAKHLSDQQNNKVEEEIENESSNYSPVTIFPIHTQKWNYSPQFSLNQKDATFYSANNKQNSLVNKIKAIKMISLNHINHDSNQS